MAGADIIMVELTNKQKVAVLLLALGVETSAQILKYLEEYQIEEIARQISLLGRINPEITDTVIKEFHQFLLTHIGEKGGVSYLKGVLERALGPSKAMSIINRLTQLEPFTYLKDIPSNTLVNLLCREHPQVIAVVLYYIPSLQAAQVLSQLPNEIKLDVSSRIAGIKYAESETVNEVNQALEKTIATHQNKGFSNNFVNQSGTKILAEILNRAESNTEKTVLEGLQKQDKILAEEIRKQMFLFNDIISLEDKALQRIIREIDSKDLALSLKLTDNSVKEKIFKNISQRAREILQEEISFLGPVKIRHIEEAQQRILEAIRRLEQAGEIEIPKHGVEEKFV